MFTIEKWKQTQTCSAITLRKKLRLLSSIFALLGYKVERDGFKINIESSLFDQLGLLQEMNFKRSY
ncbi:hypothetical protein VIBNISO65_1070004 [Vibrio nigripulchritudo SO65]|nr:hypothetical protein VIBNIAM115_650080 [Vibrio nigripulchritudo AM115]CCN39515.1 hypothetical protein VIBNIFTn2_1050022 [Vibrio nigripulchritudo FTn2]CCN66858.1 hypothetical protein VIBNIPon4_630079 [Vibrio nigripulchritudo POn4]CCN74356.1 hypothetical protein VIBNISO65_1070004 [Vibrio nigripulchritudo SO65]BCL69206.1 hypothetical protein VNTUMSATTG_11430 [Vibrio nigripulchritudo]